MSKFAIVFVFLVLPMNPLFGQPSAGRIPAPTIAAPAINAMGVDLLHATSKADQNTLLSPYSIESALVMTYAGADGKTREEMARVLHLNGDDTQIASTFSALQAQLDTTIRNGARGTILEVANRLFGEKDYDFRPAFLDLLKTQHHAPFEPMDFVHNATGARNTINAWVESKTKDRIRDLVPIGAVDASTRLVLVNALYLKAAWAEQFSEQATQPIPFHVRGGEATNVPMMTIQKSFGYLKANGMTVVSVPYKGNELQFLIILPDETNGLAAVEAGLTAKELAGWSVLPRQVVRLFLPKFKMEPPTLMLGDALQKLGMKTAFDNPGGSANFDRMAPRQPNDYLYISRVLHKTFISVDENGTEAAAATAVMMGFGGMPAPPPIAPVVVKVDHSFLFAIQHLPSGACLFLGHVVDPR